MPGVLEFLSDTSRRAALLTNKPDAPTRRILEHFDLASRFESILCGDTTPARKPAPDGFLKIIADAGVTQADVIMVGDDTPDILGANAAGIDSVFIRNGYGKLETNPALSPTYSIAHFSDLLNLGIL
jgi:phosphoglycolate phosphatase